PRSSIRRSLLGFCRFLTNRLGFSMIDFLGLPPFASRSFERWPASYHRLPPVTLPEWPDAGQRMAEVGHSWSYNSIEGAPSGRELALRTMTELATSRTLFLYFPITDKWAHALVPTSPEYRDQLRRL